jgi:hypothetical protein
VLYCGQLYPLVLDQNFVEALSDWSTAVPNTPLASTQLADDMGLDLGASTSRLKLGIGGRSAEAIFAPVQIRLYRDHSDEEFVTWTADIGFLTPWDAEFYVILGQVGFFDEFTVSMSRRLLATHIGPEDALADQVNSTR